MSNPMVKTSLAKMKVNVLALHYPLLKSIKHKRSQREQNDDPRKMHMHHGRACGGGEAHLSPVTAACGSLVITVLEALYPATSRNFAV